MEYDLWLEKHSVVFDSELAAIREVLPQAERKSGIEVGLGTGRYASALGIPEGVEATEIMREAALERGIVTRNALAENLPYRDFQFDYILMVYSIWRFNRLDSAFHEANRVLTNNGVLIIGFIDKESMLGKHFEIHKSESKAFNNVTFYTVDRILSELTTAGFQHFTLRQTLFGELDSIISPQTSLQGFGRGSFVVIKARKKFIER